jgi:hypothetical protein
MKLMIVLLFGALFPWASGAILGPPPPQENGSNLPFDKQYEYNAIIANPDRLVVRMESKSKVVLEAFGGELIIRVTKAYAAFSTMGETYKYEFGERAPLLYSRVAKKLAVMWIHQAYPTLFEPPSDNGLARRRRLDNPGCDYWPDNHCDLGCCADHDKCYQDNGCTSDSWKPGTGSAACKKCNKDALHCIIHVRRSIS